MSYKMDVAFKYIPDKSKVLDFIQEFKQVVLDHKDEYLKENFRYSPPYPYTRFSKKDESALKDLTEYWIQQLFTYKMVYLDEYQVLAVIAYPYDYIKNLFDTCIYFQNSNDQDYEYDYWSNILTFKAISDRIQHYSKQDLVELKNIEPEELEGFYDNKPKIDYHKQSLIYTTIYDSIEKDLWGETNKIFGVQFVTDWYEIHMLRIKVEKMMDEYNEEQKKETEEWNAKTYEEKFKQLRKCFTEEKVKEMLSKEKNQ